MKRLNKKELETLSKKMKKSGRTTEGLNVEVILLLNKIMVNESCLINPEDWHTKTQPNCYINQKFRPERSEKKFSIRTLIDDMGWVVTRIK